MQETSPKRSGTGEHIRHTLAAVRVLIVLPFPPALEGGAAARCAVALIRGLIGRGVDCNVLAVDYDGAPAVPEDLPAELLFLNHPTGRYAKALVRWTRLVSPRGHLRRSPFGARLSTLIADVDLVHCVGLDVAMAMPSTDRPTVVQLDCLTLRDRKLGAPWRADGRVTLELLRAERRVCARFDWLLADTPEVAEALANAAPHAQVALAQLALDPSHYRQQASLEQPVAGLIGTARWPPTANAVARLLTAVWPRVIERRPDARLLLAGDGMEPSSFPHIGAVQGVRWCGAVASASEFVSELGVLLYPLTSGSGLKVKVLEALALGVPVLTTPDGAEGLCGHEGVEIQTDDASLADSAVALLDDLRLRRLMGAAGHENFMLHHTPHVAAEPVVELYRRMLG